MDFTAAAVAANSELFEFIKTTSDPSLYQKNSVGAGGDRSAGIDLKAEEIFVKHLTPFGRIYSEESGYIGTGEATIYLDPIDGSDNFLSNVPYFGTSVALEQDGTVTHGIVCNLATGELFIRTPNTLKKECLHTHCVFSFHSNPNAAVGLFEKAYSSPHECKLLSDLKIKYRSLGAVALSLAYAHNVRFVFFKGNARDFDVKAGLYLCRDLHTYRDEKAIIVSQDRVLFDTLFDLFVKGNT